MQPSICQSLADFINRKALSKITVKFLIARSFKNPNKNPLHMIDFGICFQLLMHLVTKCGEMVLYGFLKQNLMFPTSTSLVKANHR